MTLSKSGNRVVNGTLVLRDKEQGRIMNHASSEDIVLSSGKSPGR
jgi:hypothetical protein